MANPAELDRSLFEEGYGPSDRPRHVSMISKAQEIVDDMQTALEQFSAVMEGLKG
ncbi:MAG: hypothetical protein WCJ35_12675 [Planctomycetota bacterium]